MQSLKILFEYLGEDRDVPGAKMFSVEAIHVTTTGNKRKFTMKELQLAGRSLSFRPLDINHDEHRGLKFPENMTVNMDFDSTKLAVAGRVRIADETTLAAIESGKIKKVSIEQIPTLGETCNEVACEQHGVAFIGLGLLEDGVLPGDDRAELVKMEKMLAPNQFKALWNVNKISECIISNDQRTCKDCTDFEACHTCKHTVEQGDDCVSNAIKEITRENPNMDRDQVIAIALSKCGKSRNPTEAWWWYNRTIERILPQIKYGLTK